MSDRFEYVFLDVKKNEEVLPEFDNLGKGGWELVSWRELPSTGSRDTYEEWLRFYFKKRLPPERKKPTRRKKKA